MENIICIYHGNCADGFTAAWAVWKIFPDAEFYPATYGNSPPDVKGKNVIMVDFSYKKPVLDEICKNANSIIILDHHKTAAEDLKEAKQFSKTWEDHKRNVYQDRCENAAINGAILYAVFDMERSGAKIAWEFFHPDTPVPQLVRHVEDRDLWRFRLGKTREIQAYLFSHEYTFEEWEYIAGMCDDPEGHKEMAAAGAAIERKHFKDIAELIKASKRRMYIGGHEVYVVNLPYTMASDACHALCKEPMYPSGSGELNVVPPFGASYFDGPEGRTFSLRSIGEFDVSEIAKKYGGGGHKNAAGFRMPIGWEGEDNG